MRFILILLFLSLSDSLLSQHLQGFSDAEALGSGFCAISDNHALQLLYQPAVPLSKMGLYAGFSSTIPTVSGLSRDFQIMLAKRTAEYTFKFGLVQAGNHLLKHQNLQFGLAKRLLPEFFMGIDFLFLHSGIPEYVSGNLPAASLSMFYQLNAKLQMASCYRIRPKYDETPIQNEFRLNVNWKINPHFVLSFHHVKPAAIELAETSAALRLNRPQNIVMDAAIYLQSPGFCWGIGFQKKNVSYHFSAAWKQYSGLKFGCSIQFYQERKQP